MTPNLQFRIEKIQDPGLHLIANFCLGGGQSPRGGGKPVGVCLCVSVSGGFPGQILSLFHTGGCCLESGVNHFLQGGSEAKYASWMPFFLGGGGIATSCHNHMH